MSKLIDLTDQDFGYWHVLKRAENSKDGRAMWLCQCQACGTVKPVAGGHLRGGKSTNCGCIRAQKMRIASMKDETGKNYGFLHVEREATIEERPRLDRTGVYWNCTCTKCGRKNVIVLGDYLRNGDTKSCGCIISYHETQIAQLLEENTIKYKPQIFFLDLLSPISQNHKLYFDFGIYNENDELQYLIEYDGSQHFMCYHTNESWNTEENLKYTHEKDLLKNKYCFEHNIPLIRIPYNANYEINDLRLETTRFLLTQKNEKEYYNDKNFNN